MGTALILITSIVLSLAGYAVPEVTNAVGNETARKLQKVGNEIYSKIQDNTRLLDQLYQAYINKQNDKLSSLMQGAGFGPRSLAIKANMKDIQKDYDSRKKALTDENSRLEHEYNRANIGIQKAGTSIANTIDANKTLQSIEQNVNGGLINEK